MSTERPKPPEGHDTWIEFVSYLATIWGSGQHAAKHALAELDELRKERDELKERVHLLHRQIDTCQEAIRERNQLVDAMKNLMGQTKRAKEEAKEANSKVIMIASILNVPHDQILSRDPFRAACKRARELSYCENMLRTVRKLGPIVSTMSKAIVTIDYGGGLKSAPLPLVIFSSQAISKLDTFAEQWNQILQDEK